VIVAPSAIVSFVVASIATGVSIVVVKVSSRASGLPSTSGPSLLTATRDSAIALLLTGRDGRSGVHAHRCS